MDPEQLFKAIYARPFVPFSIRLCNDRVLYVDHPEIAMMAANRWAVVIATDSGAFSVVAIPNIASIEFLAPAV